MDEKKEVERDFLTLPAGPAGNVRLRVKGDEYQICIMRPATSASDHELQKSLKRNRQMVEDSFKAMFKVKPGKTKVDDLISPTRNALIARANIDMLIPLINIKGGVASYISKEEGLDVVKHVEKLRDDAAKKVAKIKKKNPYDNLILILLVISLTAVIIYLIFN